MTMAPTLEHPRTKTARAATPVVPRRIAGFDFDETLVRSRDAAIAAAKRMFGVEPVQEILRTKGLTSAFPTLSETQLDAVLAAPLENWRELEPTSDRIPEIFRETRKAGFDAIYIVTGTRGRHDLARLWFSHHGIEYDAFVSVKHGSQRKSDVWTSVLADDSIATGLEFGRLRRPYLWVRNGSEVDRGTREELLRHGSVVEVMNLEQVPYVLAHDQKFLSALRRSETR
jgi:hypothetical protein